MHSGMAPDYRLRVIDAITRSTLTATTETDRP